MLTNDFDSFAELFKTVADSYSKTLSALQLKMYFKVLSKYPIDLIQLAVEAHLSDADRGRFMPVPADLIHQLEKMRFDNRPSAEEAWSTAIQAVDERVSFIWTEETQDAWYAAASELIAIGDKFNASRGFIAKYNDLVSVARLQAKPVVWVVAQGYDKDLRDQVIRQAHKDKKISAEYAKILLPYHTAHEGTLERIQSNVALMIESKGATDNHKNLNRVDEIRIAGETHQKRIAELNKAIGNIETVKKRNPLECLNVFEQAERLGVFHGANDKKHWLETAGSGGDMSVLQQRILAKRGAA